MLLMHHATWLACLQVELYQLCVNTLFKFNMGSMKSLDLVNLETEISQMHDCERKPLTFEEFVIFFERLRLR